MSDLIDRPETHEKRTGTHACDCISRQAAIDALDDIESEVADGFGFQYEKWRKHFADLSSVQPEIIRCKDCKHWDGADTCDVIDAPVWDNDFCSLAERRTDEID